MHLFHVSFLAFLKSICLIALIRWNDFSYVVFVGFLRCFLYSTLTILSTLSHFLFHHATGDLFFVSGDVLRMVFSATCNIILTSQLYATSIVFWRGNLVVILLSL